MAMSVGPLIWSRTKNLYIYWIVMKFGTYIHGPQKINPKDSGERSQEILDGLP